MAVRIVILVLFNSIIFSCINGQTPVEKKNKGRQNIILTSDGYQKLKNSFESVNKAYQLVRSRGDFGQNMDREGVSSKYFELKQAWETIQEAKLIYESGKKLVQFAVNLESVQALKESAIGATLKMDEFIAPRIKSFNEKHFLDVLVRYYTGLANTGNKQYEQRIQELTKRKLEVKDNPDTFSELLERYKGCEPCSEFYLTAKGSNKHIRCYKELMKIEQFPGLLNLLVIADKRMVENNMPTREEPGFEFDENLVSLLDSIWDYQMNKCGSDTKNFENIKDGFEAKVDKLLKYIESKNVRVMGTSRNSRSKIAACRSSTSTADKFKKKPKNK